MNGLVELCKSIRALELYIERGDNNREIVILIKIPKKLHDVRLLTRNGMNVINESFYINKIVFILNDLNNFVYTQKNLLIIFYII